MNTLKLLAPRARIAGTPAVPNNAFQRAGPDRSTPESFQYHSAKTREDIPNRYEIHFTTPWHHGGINE
jgi:hypothetical protein